MAKYRKKPVVVEAVQWTGKNIEEIASFMGRWPFQGEFAPTHMVIETLEGNMHAFDGDYIIKGVNGEFYPCKPDIFERMFDYNPCQGCEYYNKPYWSVISPCATCSRNIEPATNPSTTRTAWIDNTSTKIGKACMICGSSVTIACPTSDSVVCDKCKAAVLKVRKEMEEDNA